MRVSVVRSGGFAGIEQRVGALDTADLPPHAAAEVTAAVENVAAAAPEVGADLVTYTVTVTDDDDGQRTYSVSDPEGADPAEAGAAAGGLETLLRHLAPPA